MKFPSFLFPRLFTKETFLTCCLMGASVVVAQSTTPNFSSDAKGNIFTNTHGVLNLSLPPDIVGGDVVIRDEFGNVVMSVSLSEENKEVISISLSNKGYYSISADLKLADGSSVSAETSAAVVGPLIPDTLRMQSPLGLWTVQGDADLVLAAGARWNRRMISIHTVSEKLLDPDPPLAERNLFSDSPFTQVGVMSFGLPLWLMEPTEKKKSFGNPLTKPRDWGRLKALVSAWVRQQEKNFPAYFEIYNEPEWQWVGGSNAELVRVLATIADGIKEASPETSVLGPGFSSIRIKDSARLDLVTANDEGLFDHLDGLVVHAYVDGSAPEEEFIQRVIELRGFLDSIGRPSFPIHLTEFGWTSGKGTWQKPVDELTQARYAVRSLALLAAVGVENATFFCLQYKAAPNAGERGFSLVHEDSTPKPSYAAYANVARWLAGVDGGGTWLRMTPTTHLILFDKTDNTSIAISWDTESVRTIGLPFETVRREDMMGRTLHAATPELEVSPSPVFLEFSGPQSPKIRMLPVLEVMRGGDELVLPQGYSWIAPAPLMVDGGGLYVPPTAANGDYLLLSRMETEWIGQPIRVIPPIQSVDPALVWPANTDAPLLTTTLTSYAGAPVSTRVAVALDGVRDRFLDSPLIQPGEKRDLAVPLDGLIAGQRYLGHLAIDSRYEGRRDRITRPLDLTILAADPIMDNAAEPDWGSVPLVDFTDWDPFGGPIDREDCSATLQAAYGTDGLHLRIVVRDDEHFQERSGENIWSHDALQIGFDPDFEKTWEANDLFGLKGHRVFEYGVAWNGKEPMTWRWISYVPELPVGESEPRIGLQVDRNDGLTTYQMMFPWSTLGLDEPMEAGSAIGISLSLNDADRGEKGRQALRLFGGIAEGKDPEKYGPLWLR